MRSKPKDNRLSWEDSIIISRDNPIIKSLSKFGSRRLSHQSQFFPRLSPIIFSQKALFFRRFSGLPKFFCFAIALPRRRSAFKAGFFAIKLWLFFSFVFIYSIGLPIAKSELRLSCCKTTFEFNNYLFGTFEKLSYFCSGF